MEIGERLEKAMEYQRHESAVRMLGKPTEEIERSYAILMSATAPALAQVVTLAPMDIQNMYFNFTKEILEKSIEEEDLALFAVEISSFLKVLLEAVLTNELSTEEFDAVMNILLLLSMAVSTVTGYLEAIALNENF